MVISDTSDVHMDSLMSNSSGRSISSDAAGVETSFEDINNVNNSDDSNHNSVEPRVGMEFPTYIAAYNFYNAYARVKGFSVRISSSNHSRKTGELICKTFLCNKEGKKSLHDKREHGREINRRRDTRVGCKARLRVSRTKTNTWLVSKFVSEHTNHELTSPDKIARHYSHRKLHRTRNCQDVMDKLHDAGLNPSTISRVLNVASGSQEETITPQQVSDHTRKHRKSNMGNECISVIRQFLEKRTSDPDFYFAIELDSTGTMRSVFWADGRSKASFLKFSDVVVFDVTYRTNKLALPFAPFTGVNHHRQSSLFGCALLADEEEDTFVWLFNEWLKCMNGIAPLAIITDQDKAICNAIQIVFPNTRHRYCNWHLGFHIAEHLISLQRLYGVEFEGYFNSWRYSKTIETCIQYWEELRDKFNIKVDDEGWLQTMYKKRSHWVSCYLKDTFFAGMTSSQRSESINAFFDTYVNSQTMLPDFVQQYDKAVLCRRAEELNEDFASIETKPIMHLHHPIEIQVGELYTRAIFNRFQDELKKCGSLFHDNIEKEASIVYYSVGSHSDDRSKWENVVYDQNEELKVTCTCAMFETEGILCRHILHIMILNQIIKIPEHYILHRWTKAARHRNISAANVLIGRSIHDNKEQMCILRSWALRAKFNSVLEMAVYSPTLLEDLESFLSNLMEKVEKEVKVKDAERVETTNQFGFNTPNSDTIEKIAQITIRDPSGPAKTKGRPKKLSRLKFGAEKVQDAKEIKKRTCSRCHQVGHYRTSCTNPIDGDK